MKILRLDLIAFGPFTGATLDFSAGRAGLHVIYGPNEAGKSSALRALHQMLYGIKGQTDDAFLHPYPKLRIGVTLTRDNDDPQTFIRRKGNKNTLRGADDEAVVEEAELRTYLAGVDQNQFSSMFGIDYDQLVAGGQAIINGDGDMGQILFAAGAGIADLRNVQKGLREEMESLFKPTGSLPRINRAIAELKEARDAVKSSAVTTQQWETHTRALKDALDAKREVEQEIERLERERSRLGRIRAALPDIARLRECRNELPPYAGAVVLPAGFSHQRRELQEELRLAEAQQREAERDLSELEQALAGLDVPAPLLDQADAIDQLYRRLGNHQKAMRDRPERMAESRTLEAEAHAILRSLRPDLPFEQVETLRLTDQDRVRILNLGAEQKGIATRVTSAQTNLRKVEQRIAQLTEELRQLPEAADTAPLAAAIRAAQAQGDLEAQRQGALEEFRHAEQQAELTLKRLRPWGGTLAEVEALPLPPGETVDRFESELEAQHAALTQLQSRLDQEAQRIQDLEGRLKQLKLEREVPTEQDLDAARQQRREGWELVRRAWLEKTPAAESADFVAAHAPGADLASAFARSIEKADEVVDRLRRESDRVAQKAQILAERDKRACDVERLNEKLQSAEASLAAKQQQWNAAWDACGFTPLTPREMRGWLRTHREISAQTAAIRRQRSQLDAVDQRIEQQRAGLRQCLSRFGEAGIDAAAGATMLLQTAQQWFDRLTQTVRRRDKVRQDLADAEAARADLQIETEAAQGELAGWQKTWGAQMQRLGLPADATPAEANQFLDGVTELFRRIERAADLYERIRGIDDDADRFKADAAMVARQAAADLQELPVEQIAARLQQRLQDARTARQRMDDLQRQQQKAQQKLRGAKDTIVRVRGRLDGLCQEAGVETHEDLPAAEERSERRQQLEAAQRELKDRILLQSGGAALEEFLAQAEQVDPDSLMVELQRTAEQLEGLHQKRDEILKAMTIEQDRLDAMDGSAKAAEADEAAQNVLARLGSDVEEYARLRLASEILKEAAERYRRKHQGPVLRRANELFAKLTLGSFSGLRADFDDQGRPVLVGIRSDGEEPVGIKGMSDGTADQLYLALRLASLEDWLEHHEPMPLVIDDVLVNFDDHRAAAALEAFAELSKKTQVLLFTHHRHLIDLARKTLPKKSLAVHELMRGGAPAAEAQTNGEPSEEVPPRVRGALFT